MHFDIMTPRIISMNCFAVLATILFLQPTLVESSYQKVCRSIRRFAAVTFNGLALSSCLAGSVYIPNAAAVQESKLESLYHISKPLPFKESKERYKDLLDSSDKEAIYNMNRYLIDYTFGTITTVSVAFDITIVSA